MLTVRSAVDGAQVGPVGDKIGLPRPQLTKGEPGVSLTQGSPGAHAAQGGVALGPVILAVCLGRKLCAVYQGDNGPEPYSRCCGSRSESARDMGAPFSAHDDSSPYSNAL